MQSNWSETSMKWLQCFQSAPWLPSIEFFIYNFSYRRRFEKFIARKCAIQTQTCPLYRKMQFSSHRIVVECLFLNIRGLTMSSSWCGLSHRQSITRGTIIIALAALDRPVLNVVSTLVTGHGHETEAKRKKKKQTRMRATISLKRIPEA